MSYTKLFGSILSSTIWQESNETRIVWITLLAMADKHGEVQAAVPGLAHMARVSIADTEKALEVLSSPDKFSRTADDEGRRIQPIDGGWVILNHAKYRDKSTSHDQRAKAAERQRRHRERQKLNGVTPPPPADDRSRPDSWPALEDVKAFAETLCAPPECAERFWNDMEGVGWEKRGTPVRNWKPIFTSYATAWKANEAKAKKAAANGHGHPKAQARTAWHINQEIDATTEQMAKVLGFYQPKDLPKADREKWNQLKAHRDELKNELAGLPK